MDQAAIEIHKQLAQLAAIDSAECLVRLFVLLQKRPFLAAAERAYLENAKVANENGQEIDDALDEDSASTPSRISGLADKPYFPLILLRALDEHLAIRWGVSRFENTPPLFSVNGKTYAIHIRTRRLASNFTRQTGHVHHWLRHHWVFPLACDGITISARFAEGRMRRDLDGLSKNGAAKIYIGSFPPGDAIYPIRRFDDATFLFESSDAWPKRWDEARRHLESARDSGADIVIFPELTLCERARSEISRWLKDESHALRLVVAGSFHVSDARTPSESHNEMVAFDGIGTPALFHRKLVAIGDFASDGSLKRKERIVEGHEIRLLGSAAGLMAIPICRDFLEVDRPFGPLWQDIGPEWVFVPSMGVRSTFHGHQRRAHELRISHGTITATAHQDRRDHSNERDHGFVIDPNSEKCTEITETARVIRVVFVENRPE